MSVPERFIRPPTIISAGGLTPTVVVPPTAWTEGQVVVGVVATLIIAANPARRGLIIVNMTATTVFLAPTNAVAITDFPLIQNQSIPFSNTADVWGIVAAGNTTVAFAEET